MSNLRITTLVENTKISAEYENKHGLSFHIETEKHNILFDLGPKNTFLTNAKKLNINLEEVDIVVISHGHNDHGGGLEEFLKINNKAKVYIHKDAFNEYYSMAGIFKKYIGLDKELKKNPRIILTEGDMKIDDELYLFSVVENRHKVSKFNKVLYKRVDGMYLEDDFVHEQSLIITEDNKNVLMGGCAHNDIRNIIDKAEVIIGKDLDYVISGFHIFNPSTGISESDLFINTLGDNLNKRNTKFYTCHCTGMRAFKILEEKLQDKIEYISTGQVLNI
ncbi:MBL fold metallo-hydrolase [Clostridium perfringens]|uniref:Metallo-beta-lactamase family protein n=1 Tax=Clostridium perfringens (strain SM101 / Type A) TaxID=289380 RepID=Q0SU85_CLOPS|nr:MBL fold metallo-hydrolase [Clostridium perfringens]ABG86980.1 metallo-beta-lactamase family protein [Clostridium perfringens SM101]MDK0721489.1 MBL fold metallo-hydrolase [Clostridium perfringens]MDK0768869.1 MBL fold metallo-hydrolase [Clostridium perfringens]MDK0771557.1 MBL fold metallo-hydrolase [Clostridium perfringens]MDK0774724.1 MBL fold metallo-hydrolase [Clostridium perfringens]